MIPNKYLLGAGALLLILVLGWGYGQYQHNQGYDTRDTEAKQEVADLQAQAREIELHAQLESEKARDDAYQQKQVADAAIATLTTDTTSLRGTIASQARRLKNAGPATGADAVAAACWVALDESVTEYTAMAATADGYVERLRIGQGWARVVDKKQNTK